MLPQRINLRIAFEFRVSLWPASWLQPQPNVQKGSKVGARGTQILNLKKVVPLEKQSFWLGTDGCRKLFSWTFSCPFWGSMNSKKTEVLQYILERVLPWKCKRYGSLLAADFFRAIFTMLHLYKGGD